MSLIRKLYRFFNPKYQRLYLEYPVVFRPRYGHGNPPHEKLYEIINSNRNNYKLLLNKSLTHRDSIWIIKDSKDETDNTKPTWNNGFLPGLDVVVLYTMLSEFQPKKYIEIGSGNSTKVAYFAKKNQGLSTEIISIDPMPRAEIDSLADVVVRKPFESLSINVLDDLNENDILFVDNSHRVLPNSDSMVFFLEVLPSLKKGVIVHVHDVYLPYDYPQFMCDRFYSEQYGLAMYILSNPLKFEILLPSYFISEDEELSEVISPMWNNVNMKNIEKHGGSFWFKIK